MLQMPDDQPVSGCFVQVWGHRHGTLSHPPGDPAQRCDRPARLYAALFNLGQSPGSWRCGGGTRFPRGANSVHRRAWSGRLCRLRVGGEAARRIHVATPSHAYSFGQLLREVMQGVAPAGTQLRWPWMPVPLLPMVWSLARWHTPHVMCCEHFQNMIHRAGSDR